MKARRPTIDPIELPPPPERDPYSDPVAMAVMGEMGERGYEAVSVSDVIERAGVSREDFDSRFEDLDDCALQSYEMFITHFKRRVGAAFNRHDEWRSALRAAAYETADWMEEDRRLTRFGMTEILKMKGDMGSVRREEVFAFCAQMIEAGRAFSPDPDSIPANASTMAVGSIIQLLSHRLQQGEVSEPHSFVPMLMFGVVLAYVGEEAAHEELAMSRTDD